ncbi:MULTISPECIES: acyloxyacyl hydrolase [unclassified Ensifer]|uniref:acyloxyacyl hydrolase n=1 Tax=unclassified Ensifer TaxID=2633371 RepID=UPI0008139DEF|nr:MULTISPECIES: acyloxyacyl hydrolase [unclassified Ensifer]OCP03424.1 lipid A 3-O-deacylase [Ensifer sp. LC11]OCP03778.1 lipid A 3-O-deacylase [Ensifer sp. LC13]OCP08477.1 lipid A 3-O-deacylase [Ensifer sp. LC14]OCP30249.1 lipid A 3-O-deacylase [Ensifer sp. LC499]
MPLSSSPVRSRHVATCLFLSAVTFPNASAFSADGVFDEMRFGVTTSIADGDKQEDGVFPSFTVYFDPFDADGATDLGERLLRPRIHAGGAVATSSSGVNQAYAGLSWTFDMTKRFFVEFGAGGTVHDGDLDNADGSGPQLGCRFLFREYAAAGYRLDEHWNVAATVEHASHANLCDGPNNGLTHAGLALGYKF